MPPTELETLRSGAATLGCPLDAQALDRLLAYRDLIARWNQVYNLTAVRDPAQMLTQHLLDSLAVVPPLRRHTAAAPARVLDVGSGGGLPGVVLAIACPELQVVCVDAVAKKATFIRQVAAELGLPQLQARHNRVEQLNEPGFDVITSRAFASLTDFTTLTRHLLADRGCWLAMKGPQVDAELAELAQHQPALQLLLREPLDVPGLGAQRCLIWLRPTAA
jgi:16S rRNA (guanine527-N7)-methyltransferase